MYSSKNFSKINVFFFLGTRVEDAKAIFTTSDLRILAVDNLEEAAKMVFSILLNEATIDYYFFS